MKAMSQPWNPSFLGTARLTMRTSRPLTNQTPTPGNHGPHLPGRSAGGRRRKRSPNPPRGAVSWPAILDRPLTTEEVQHFTDTARRIATILHEVAN